jgi:hypothetical protein
MTFVFIEMGINMEAKYVAAGIYLKIKKPLQCNGFKNLFQCFNKRKTELPYRCY